MRDGPRGFRRGFTCPAVLRILNGENQGSSTGLSPSLVWLPSHFDYLILLVTPKFSPTTPLSKLSGLDLPVSLAATRESNFLSLPAATKMFQFTASTSWQL